MKIQVACENKGTLPDFPNMYCLIVYLADNKLSPCWYNAKTDHFAREVTGQEVLRTDWLPFPEEKEIRPKKAGELWKLDEEYYHTEDHTSSGCGLCLVGYGSKGFKEVDNGKTAHNKNGWTRLFPSVEDESVERVEIENAYIKEGNINRSGSNVDGEVLFSVADSDFFKLSEFRHRPVKMTLEAIRADA